MVGSCNGLITGVQLQPNVRLHCPMTTLQINSWVARDVVIKIQSKIRYTFEEIVIVMIACVTIRCLLSTYKD